MSGTIPGVISGGATLRSPSALPGATSLLSVSAAGVMVCEAAVDVRTLLGVYSTTEVDDAIAAIELLPGPQGDPGATGATGPQGDPGPNEVTTSTATNITGLLKGDGATVSAATANTDYAPATHASRHTSGGADAIKLDDLAAPDDNTDLDATTSAHGLLKKLSNVSTEFLNGQGNWATPAGGGQDAAKAVSGMWYSGQDPTTNGAGVAISADTLYLCPFRFGAAETWDAIFTHCNATGTATLARLGIYEADFTTGPPTFTLLVDAGTVSLTGTGSKSITGLARAIAAGKMVFLAILSNGTWTNLGATGVSLRAPLLHGQTTSINGGLVTHYMKSVTYGALPSSVSSVSNGSTNLPSTGLRIA